MTLDTSAETTSAKAIKQVAAAIVLHEGCILVARRAPGQHLEGLWEFPGGKLEPNETPQCCVVRELAEELAIDVVPGETLTESLHVYPGGAINLIAVTAYARVRDVSLTVHDAVKWLKPSELLTVELAPADIPIAQEILRRFGE